MGESCSRAYNTPSRPYLVLFVVIKKPRIVFLIPFVVLPTVLIIRSIISSYILSEDRPPLHWGLRLAIVVTTRL